MQSYAMCIQSPSRSGGIIKSFFLPFSSHRPVNFVSSDRHGDAGEDGGDEDSDYEDEVKCEEWVEFEFKSYMAKCISLGLFVFVLFVYLFVCFCPPPPLKLIFLSGLG